MSGVVVGAIASGAEAVKGSSTARATEKFASQPWGCTHWTPSEKAALLANADEKRLCEEKGKKDVDWAVVWRPNGSPCDITMSGCAGAANTYSTSCCEKQKWQCEHWTATDLQAINANADEKILCEKKIKDTTYTEDVVFKYMPDGHSCTQYGCACCVQERYTML